MESLDDKGIRGQCAPVTIDGLLMQLMVIETELKTTREIAQERNVEPSTVVRH